MAIFRAGKRIGNMDIRVGLPRDRSMTTGPKGAFTAEGSERLSRDMTIGMNQSTSIGRFITEINRGEGVARANRFLIRMFPPRDLIQQGDDVVGNNVLETYSMTRNVELMCTNIKLPHRDLATTNYVTYGPGRQMPYAYVYGSHIDATFMGDKFLRQRAFFENWQGKIYNLSTHNLEYYDNYVGTMEIYQLGHYRESKDEHPSDSKRLTYGVRLQEVYPESVGEIQYQALTDDMIPMDIPIRFAYRTWENITLASLQGVGFNEQVPDMPNIKPAPNYGMIGTILSKMPGEMKRATKQVINKIRRDMPTGKITGGRAFPPFEINKTN